MIPHRAAEHDSASGGWVSHELSESLRVYWVMRYINPNGFARR
jgi:hypothetical protein